MAWSGLAAHINNMAAAAVLAKQPHADQQYFVDDTNLNYRCDNVSRSPWQSLFAGYPESWTGLHLSAAPPLDGIVVKDGKGENCTAINCNYAHRISEVDTEVAFREMGLVLKQFWHFELQTQAYITR